MIANGNGTTNTNTKDYQYGVWLGNYFKDLPNIVWSSGNDFQCSNSTAAKNDVLSVANGIASTDPAALQTLEADYCSGLGYTCEGSTALTDTGTQGGEGGTPQSTGWSSRATINGAYTYAPAYGELRVARGQSPTMPAFLSESNYETETDGGTDGCTTVRNCRLQEWWTMTSGGAGQLYGCACTTHLSNANYPNGMDTPGVTQLGYQTTLLNSLGQWYNLIPDTTHRLITAGYGTCPTTGSIASVTCVTDAQTPDRTLALAYDPTGTTLTVDFTQMSGDMITRWYDPTNGSFHNVTGSPFSLADGSVSIPTPGTNGAGNADWVLVIQDNRGALLPCDLNATPANFTTQVSAATSGQTICLGAGTYSQWGGGTSKKLTIEPQAGVTASFCFDLYSTSHLVILGGHTTYDSSAPGITNNCATWIEASSSNVLVEGLAETCNNPTGACLEIDNNGPEGVNYNVFHDLLYPNTTQAALRLYGGVTESYLLHAEYNLFRDGGEHSIEPAGATAIGNDFINVSGHTAGDPRHTDWFFWGSAALPPGNVILGSYGNNTPGGLNCTQGIFDGDGTSPNIIEDNVVIGCDTHELNVAGDNAGSQIDHNTVTPGGEECGSKANPPGPSLSFIRDNYFQSGINWGGTTCSLSQDANNMSYPSYGLISSGSDFIGSPGFAGGTNPATYAGYALATGSPGSHRATDGTDVGARVALYPRPTGLP